MSWENNVRMVEPYVPGEQPNKPKMIKLNTNENPYGPAPGVRQAIAEFDIDRLRLYPDALITGLTQDLAEYYHLKTEQIFVGVGSDDVLALAFLTFFNSGKPILFPDITYSFYDVWAGLYRIPYKTIPLREDFRICMEDYLIENGGIVIANPNAPTGVLESVEDLEIIIQKNQNSVVIIDEAYIDFGGNSCLPLIDKYDNLLVVQTFSKSRSMAGMRIGFAMGNAKLIRYLSDAKFATNSYTMNLPALILGREAVKDVAYFKDTLKKIIKTREWTKQELKNLGFSFTDSYSNFIFASHKECRAKDIFEALRENDIYVRYFPKARIDNYLRISIGTDEEMKLLIEALTKYLKK